MKVAIVYDRMNKVGGAERILVNLHAIFPDAPFYTSVFDPSGAAWSAGFRVIPSFLQKISFARKNHEFFPWVTPLAFENFSFNSFDVVISVTSAEAKSVITKPETLHICYCLTPTRYLWSGVKEYATHSSSGGLARIASWFLRVFLRSLRMWDKRASFRPDAWIAISALVKKRIESYYSKHVFSIVYPPVDDMFFQSPLPMAKGEYFLIVSRLVSYKRIDIVIKACNVLRKKLIVVGDGREKRYLKKLAGRTVQFIDRYLTDVELLSYYRACSAFLFAGVEDFGLVAAEAQAVGKPVIAYSKSGISEIIDDRKTGILFHEQSVQSLVDAMRQFDTMNFSSKDCRAQVLAFRSMIFKKKFLSTVKDVYNTYMKNIREGNTL
ncbi:glycosyltransferase [Candidatus Gottesmanbacteria bacterium]|nr:glycosyltransferase [Candidatus Gottesmanbacteria bacterium]